jgi:thioredoxin 1
VLKIELISSSGCKECVQAREELKAVATEVAQGSLQWRDVNVLDELDYAVSLGVLTLPAMAVNGKLAFPSLPTPEQLRTEIVRHLGRK